MTAMRTRVLEARFHPKRGAEHVVVGYLRWRGRRDGENPVVEVTCPSPSSLMRRHLLSKLEYLIKVNSPASFERLQALRSQFWSFVDVRRATPASVRES